MLIRSCINNTELAQEESFARGSKGTITAPILKSVVARDLKTRQDQEERRARQNAAASRTKDEIFNASEECLTVLKECLAIDEAASQRGVIVSASEVVRDLLVQAELASAQLAEILAIRSGDQKSKSSNPICPILMIQVANQLRLCSKSRRSRKSTYSSIRSSEFTLQSFTSNSF